MIIRFDIFDIFFFFFFRLGFLKVFCYCCCFCFAEYVGGYKAESDAAFNWNSAEAVHEVSYVSK